MGLADRDYMKSNSRPTGKVTRLDGSSVEGLRWNSRDGVFVSSPTRTAGRTIMRRAAWIAFAVGVFTFAWSIGCAVVGAEWAGKGPVFEPPASSQPSAGASSNGAR